MNLAPIVLFVYNRPLHAEQTLNALMQNDLAGESILYIYSDGAKEYATPEDLLKIQEVRKLIRSKNWCKEVHIIESEKNKGLADSIIEGVTTVVNQFGKIIVLEDDLIVSPFFLHYMNDSLSRYENNVRVGQIGACNFFACNSKFPDTFFIPIPDCLGWGTWKNRWNHFVEDAGELLKLLKENNLLYRFNVYGSHDMEGLLKMQIEGKVSSWAIRWQAVCILNDWLTLYPNPSMTNHIGSSDATHSAESILPPLNDVRQEFITIDTVEIPDVIAALKSGYAGTSDYNGNLKTIIHEVSKPLTLNVQARIRNLLLRIKNKIVVVSKNQVN